MGEHESWVRIQVLKTQAKPSLPLTLQFYGCCPWPTASLCLGYGARVGAGDPSSPSPPASAPFRIAYPILRQGLELQETFEKLGNPSQNMQGCCWGNLAAPRPGFKYLMASWILREPGNWVKKGTGLSWGWGGW